MARILGIPLDFMIHGKLGGNAIASDILLGKKATNDLSVITGTIPSKSVATITPSTVNQIITANQFLSGAQTILGDANLVAGNILSGKKIFNVNGTALKDPVCTLYSFGTNGQANFSKVTSPVNTGTAYFTKEAYRMNVRARKNGNGIAEACAATDLPIDVTPYSKLLVCWYTNTVDGHSSGSSSESFACVLSPTRIADYNNYSARILYTDMHQVTTMDRSVEDTGDNLTALYPHYTTLDVSGVTGNHYIRFHCQVNNERNFDSGEFQDDQLMIMHVALLV